MVKFSKNKILNTKSQNLFAYMPDSEKNQKCRENKRHQIGKCQIGEYHYVFFLLYTFRIENRINTDPYQIQNTIFFFYQNVNGIEFLISNYFICV